MNYLNYVFEFLKLCGLFKLFEFSKLLLKLCSFFKLFEVLKLLKLLQLFNILKLYELFELCIRILEIMWII